MNVLMLTAYFPPEVGSASHLFFELGGEFVRRGHKVTVMTGYPVYNITEDDLPARYRSGWWMQESFDGINVVRIRTPGMPRHIPILRGIGQFTMAVGHAIGGFFLRSFTPDIILVYSPPLFLALSAIFLRSFKKGKVIVNVQDLFPQSAVDLNLLRNTLLINLFRKVESFVYTKADAVTVHSPGNKDHVEICGGRPETTRVIPNPVDTRRIVPGARNNAFRHRYGINQRQFIVSFAGVIGYSQDLDTVIDAAELLKDTPDIQFYIAGDGLEKNRLLRRAEGIRNIVFLPILPREEYVQLLHGSDVCLATLRRVVKTPVVPSKILSIMAAGRPVVASMPLTGDAPALIRDARCGICIEPENPAKLADAIRSIYHKPEIAAAYGEQGRKFAEDHFSLDACATMYERIFTE